MSNSRNTFLSCHISTLVPSRTAPYNNSCPLQNTSPPYPWLNDAITPNSHLNLLHTLFLTLCYKNMYVIRMKENIMDNAFQ